MGLLACVCTHMCVIAVCTCKACGHSVSACMHVLINNTFIYLELMLDGQHWGISYLEQRNSLNQHVKLIHSSISVRMRKVTLKV